MYVPHSYSHTTPTHTIQLELIVCDASTVRARRTHINERTPHLTMCSSFMVKTPSHTPAESQRAIYTHFKAVCSHAQCTRINECNNAPECGVYVHIFHKEFRVHVLVTRGAIYYSIASTRSRHLSTSLYSLHTTRRYTHVQR